jgi:hypothetical protein
MRLVVNEALRGKFAGQIFKTVAGKQSSETLPPSIGTQVQIGYDGYRVERVGPEFNPEGAGDVVESLALVNSHG